MSRVVTTGLESGVVADECDVTNAGVTIETTTVRTGAYSMKAVSGAGAVVHVQFNFFGGSVAEIYGGFAIFPTTTGSNGSTILAIVDAGGHTILSLVLSSTMGLSVTCNGTTGTGIYALTGSNWNYIEYHFKFDNSGAFECKLNGVTDTGLSISGDTTPTGYTNPIAVRHGSSMASTAYFDDIVVNNTAGTDNNSWPGRVKLYPIRPAAAGDVTGLTRGGTDRGANWDQVDEVPASATDYVYHDTADNYDLYNLTTVTLPEGYEISNVVVVNDAYLDSGAGSLTGILKSTTEEQGADHALTATAHCHSDAFSLKPDDTAWDQTAIDGLQAGPKVR